MKSIIRELNGKYFVQHLCGQFTPEAFNSSGSKIVYNRTIPEELSRCPGGMNAQDRVCDMLNDAATKATRGEAVDFGSLDEQVVKVIQGVMFMKDYK